MSTLPATIPSLPPPEASSSSTPPPTSDARTSSASVDGTNQRVVSQGQRAGEEKVEPIFVPLEEQSEEDRRWMRVALEMAEEAIQAAEVPVGCVFVRNGEAIAKARNRTNEWRNATLHAELVSLDQILLPRSSSPSPKSSQDPDSTSLHHSLPLTPPLTDVTLYVTVEPCVMCASALRQVGIGRVFYGAANERFGGCGGVLGVNDTPRITTNPGYKALGGYYREEAILLLRRFYLTANTNAPKPKNKGTRVLKTEFAPIKARSGAGSPAPAVV